MPLDDRYRVNSPMVTSQIIDGEAIMINLESGNYYNLNETGTYVWDSIEKGHSVRQIAASIAQQYDGEQTQIEHAVAQLIAELKEEELIVIDEREAGMSSSSPFVAQPSPPDHIKRKFEEPVLQKYTDMQDLLLLDPIHEVDELGWPRAKDDAAV